MTWDTKKNEFSKKLKKTHENKKKRQFREAKAFYKNPNKHKLYLLEKTKQSYLGEKIIKLKQLTSIQF